nr:Gal-binding and CUB domains containing protein 2 [Arenicola marina]
MFNMAVSDMPQQLLYASAVLWLVSATQGTTENTCVRETFNPVCGANEVVVMRSAVFGRMELGDCIRNNFGHIGCQADALQLLDSLCSGRASCSLVISMDDEQLLDINKCPGELTGYLKSAHDCIQVEQAAGAYCHSAMRLSQSSGVIASHVTDTTRCGSPQAPWTIHVSPGQRVNISIVDFGWRQQTGSNMTIFEDIKCEDYGFVVERKLGVNKTICGGGKRQQHVYLSASSKVEITVLPSRQRQHQGFFLLEYTGRLAIWPVQPLIYTPYHQVRIGKSKIFGRIHSN